MALSTVLPHLAGLRLEQVVLAGDAVLLHLAASRRSAACPICSRRSRRVHSIYCRTVADLPLAGRRLLLRLRVRRFRCRGRRCPRSIFAEHFPGLVAAYGRRTRGQGAALEAIGLALGGSAGARLAARLGSPASRATLLRLVRRAVLAEQPTPRALGVDDWARRKGHTYGTILVDLERHRIVDLLSDRRPETLAQWLRDHPGVEVTARDRSGAYATGIRQGAPEALQVADRFHLVQNLGEALERFFNRHRRLLHQVPRPVRPTSDPERLPAPVAPAPPRPSLEAAKEHTRAKRQARYQHIRERYLRGASVSQLARDLRLNWKTVRKYAQADVCPESRPYPPRPRMLTPYEAYLRQRWAEGCHNGVRLHQEIVAQGFTGSRVHVARMVAQFRREPEAAGGETEPAHAALHQPLTPRETAMLVLRRADGRTPDEQGALDQLGLLSDEIEQALGLSQRWLQLLRERQGSDAFSVSLVDAAASSVPELRRFVTKVRQDEAAVRAACTEAWSNGQTEGQITKLKLIKRTMYGRANFDLLRRRVLRVA